MSRSAPETGAGALRRLDETVSRAVVRIRELERMLAEARRRSDELEGTLGRFTGGELKPGELIERLGHLESENADLRKRITAGREGVERLLARIRFLEEQR